MTKIINYVVKIIIVCVILNLFHRHENYINECRMELCLMKKQKKQICVDVGPMHNVIR